MRDIDTMLHALKAPFVELHPCLLPSAGCCCSCCCYCSLPAYCTPCRCLLWRHSHAFCFRRLGHKRGTPGWCCMGFCVWTGVPRRYMQCCCLWRELHWHAVSCLPGGAAALLAVDYIFNSCRPRDGPASLSNTWPCIIANAMHIGIARCLCVYPHADCG